MASITLPFSLGVVTRSEHAVQQQAGHDVSWHTIITIAQLFDLHIWVISQ